MANLIRVVRSMKKREQSQFSKDPSGQAKPTTTATETWQVVYDGIVDKLAVLTAPGLPLCGFIYNGLFCQSVNPVRSTESPYVWEVTVNYANRQPQQSKSNNYAINCRQSSVAREEVQTVDGHDKPYFNTAGELLPQLPTATLYDKVITITYTTTVPPAWVGGKFEGKVNSDTLTWTVAGITYSFAPFMVKCIGLGIGSTRTQIGTDSSGNPINQYQYDIEESFQIRSYVDVGGNERGWVWLAPNEGYKGYDYADGTTFGTFADDGHVTIGSAKNPKATKRTDPTKLDIGGQDINMTVGVNAPVIILPVDPTLAGGTQYNDYADPGRFVPYKSVAMSSLFTGINDADQI